MVYSGNSPEFGVVGEYLSKAQSGRQYVAELADSNHRSIDGLNYGSGVTGCTSHVSSCNDPNQNSNCAYSPCPSFNSNEERHSVYWQVGDSTGLAPINGTKGGFATSRTTGALVSIPLLLFETVAVYYDASNNQFQMIYFMECSSQTSCTDDNQNIDHGGDVETDSGEITTSTDNQLGVEWAMYSPPSQFYQAQNYPAICTGNCLSDSTNNHLYGYYKPMSTSQSGTCSSSNQCNGAYANSGGTNCNAAHGGSNNGFCDSSGNNYAFNTLGFHVTVAGSAMLVDQVIDTSTQYTSHIRIP